MKRIFFLSLIHFFLITLCVNAQTEAVFTVSPSTASCGVIMQFDANLSTVSSGQNIVKYEWDFDYDGVTFDIQASGVLVEHTYSRMLIYTVALRVTDDGTPALSDIATDNATLLFTNNAPVAHAGDDYYTARVNDIPASVIINAKRSSDPDSPCDEVVAYKWDTDGDGLFGSDDLSGGLCDGHECEGAIISVIDDNWMPGSTSVIELKVTDSYGLVSDPLSVSVHIVDINSLPPAINDLVIN
jgi:PKD domain